MTRHSSTSLRARMPKFTEKPKTLLSESLCKFRHRASFPLVSSIIADAGLNCCVRNENRCGPSSMGTDPMLFAALVCFRQSRNLTKALGKLRRRLRSSSHSTYISTPRSSLRYLLVLYSSKNPRAGTHTVA